uniref:Uncharacterized protein n=1 Tax=Rhizophagus irregularis (strain DAOM 181602 / DAOM 197198 / MUCL 43194) TaxID=747089 RepID=U9SXW7_RHIID
MSVKYVISQKIRKGALQGYESESKIANNEQDFILEKIPNVSWVNLHGVPAYAAIVDIFATNGLLQNQRWDNIIVFIIVAKTSWHHYCNKDLLRQQHLHHCHHHGKNLL